MAGVITPAQYVGGGDGGAVSSVFGRSGAVIAATGDYTVAQVTGAAPLASPALTGVPTAPTAGALTNSTQIGTTAYTDTAVGVEKTRALAAEALLAPLASPALTGTPTAPTAAPGDTSAQLATDAFVAAAVTAAVQGLAIKPSVQAATVAALPANTYSNGASGVGATLTAVLPGVLVVDGITVALGNRVLVQDEVAAANNGIYVVTTLGTVSVAYILTRATDMNQAAEVPGAFTFTEAGTVNGGAGFTVAGAGPYVIGTTAINWTQFSGAGEITAGAGLTKTGNTLSLGVLTTAGDLIIENATPAPARLPVGTAGQSLQVAGGLPAWGAALVLQAATAAAGYTLVNGTGNIITWTTPNDGNLHRVTIFAVITTSSTETGGAITLLFTSPSGGAGSVGLYASGLSGPATRASGAPAVLVVGPNTTVTVEQSAALTGGAAVVWAEIWGS
jgi:hypothetical protein